MEELKELACLVEPKDKILAADVILTDENLYLPRMTIVRQEKTDYEKKIRFSGRPMGDLRDAVSQIKIASYGTALSGSYEISVNIAIPVQWGKPTSKAGLQQTCF